jgi:hypothetical protein
MALVRSGADRKAVRRIPVFVASKATSSRYPQTISSRNYNFLVSASPVKENPMREIPK